MSLNPYAALTFGPLDLLGRDRTGAFYYTAITEGTEWGNPESIIRAIESFLMDGAIEVTESYGNREMTIKVAVRSSTSAGLAAGEAALLAELGKRNTLTWTPPDSSAAGKPCVFDVVNSSLEHEFDEFSEQMVNGVGVGRRVYQLTIKALPWARANTVTTFSSPAPPNTSPTTASVDACTATTGWAATGTGTVVAVSTSGGAVRTQATFTGGGAITLTRTGLSAVVTTTNLVRIDFQTTVTAGVSSLPSPTVKLNGVTVSEVARNGNVAWYLAPASPLTSVSVTQAAYFAGGGVVTLAINDITRSDQAQDQSGARQTFRTLPVAGSTRTQGNLSLADPSAALGSVLVYTTPITSPAVQPPLRVLRTAGSTETTDTTLCSGKYSDLFTLHTFDIPAPNVPAGGYLLLARVKHASASTYGVAWAGKSLQGTTTLDTAPPSGVASFALAADTWTIVTIGRMTLPTFSLGPSGKVRIEMKCSVVGMQLDEAWIFNLDQGRLTWVECGTAAPSAGGAANRLWVDAASLDNPAPSIWMGNASDRTDAYGAGPKMVALGEHEFAPPATNVFTVNTNSVATAVGLSYYPSFHTHVV